MYKEINFDRFVRGLLVVVGILAIYFILSYLSAVLIPFFVAWVFAYMLYPIVIFFEKKCHLKSRILCIFLTLLLVGGVVTAIGLIIVPPFVDEVSNFKEIAIQYITNESRHADSLPNTIQHFVRQHAEELQLENLLKQKDIQSAIKNALPKAWDFLWSTASVVISILSSLIGILYFFFLLLDYEKYANGWINFIPKGKRIIAAQIVGDIEHGMNGYFRGQALVALSNCVMFSVGFVIIGFPMPIAWGCFIGLISFVPYLQVVGIVPALILALLRSADTGQNFWLLIGGVALVYIVVQVLQDTIVTPHVMGKIMGLSPAIILLSLTVWGYMLGIIGLIIALPLTTLAISYYHRYIIGDIEKPSDETEEIIAENSLSTDAESK